MTTHLATAPGRKVHFEFQIGHLSGKPSCGSGDQLTNRLVALDDDGGLEGTLAALVAVEVPQSRLCRKCFAVRTRVAYAQRLATR